MVFTGLFKQKNSFFIDVFDNSYHIECRERQFSVV